MDVAVGGFAERDDAGVQAMNESTQGKEIERAGFGDIETVVHEFRFLIQGYQSRG
jgi:hypothetical protein